MANIRQKTNKRQDFIVHLLENDGDFQISHILRGVSENIEAASKMTINRDLEKLMGLGLVSRVGKGRAVHYRLSEHFHMIKHIPVEAYFQSGPDQRSAKQTFNSHVFSFLKNIFTDEEKRRLRNLHKEYQNNVSRLSPSVIKKEMERLMIEFSWKSSQIEGNTYTLLETEALLKEKQEARGHKKEEALMLLGHKKALDFVWEHPKEFQTISTKKIEHLHSLITEGLGISQNIRRSLVGITGTAYKPLDNELQIKEALDKTCELINQEKDAFTKSLIASVMIAYIQPFEDGNKRTARILGNALLLAGNACPLSYRSASESDYKKAVLLFFEQNNASYYKQLFMDQYEFAVKNYFR